MSKALKFKSRLIKGFHSLFSMEDVFWILAITLTIVVGAAIH